MISVVCAWHEHHERATREMERRLSAGERLVVAAPALVEAYAVLTRLPSPHRLSPADSALLLEANFTGDSIEMVALGWETYRHLVRGAPARGIAGGSIYDAVIAACGLAAGVDALLTFNERHLRWLAEQKLKVVVPPP